MMAPLPDNEAERLNILYEHEVLDTAPEEEFDDLVRLAAHVCGVPIAAISLIDEHRQWFKSIVGLTVPETPREAAFCAHTILQADTFIVPDAQADPRFADNPLVTGDPGIRFYAGVPLVTEEGYALGSLCVIDRTPRRLMPEQLETLRLLARQVARHLKAARRMAEREGLIQEKERLAAIVESAGEAILAATLDGTITYWNRAAERLYGYTAAEMVGQHVSRFTQPGEESPVPAVIARMQRGEIIAPIEVLRCRRDGTPFHAALSFSPIKDTDGRMVGGSCVIRDVTARRKAELETARLAAIVATCEDAVYSRALDGTILSWNGGAERLYGYSAAEMIGEQFSKIVPPDRCVEVEKAIATVIRVGYPLPLETVRLTRTGTIDVALRLSPMQDIKGHMIGVSIIARDITDRKQAEDALIAAHAALAESEVRLRRLTDAAFEGIAMTQDGLIQDVSPTFAAMFGYSTPAEMIGLGGTELVVPGSRTRVASMMAEGSEAPYEATLRRRDGTTFQAEIRGRQIQLSGRPARMTAVRDISERKHMEAALLESEMRFRTSVDAMEEGMALQGTDGAILLCNASAERILGLTADQISGRTSLDPRWQSVHEDGTDFPGDQHPSMVALREGTAQRNVVMGVHKPDGALTWVNINAVPLLPGERTESHTPAEVHGVVVTFSDITERKQMEEEMLASHRALEQSQARLAQAQQIAKVGSWEYDPVNNVVTWSQEMFRLLGRDPDAGVPPYETAMTYYHPIDAPTLKLLVKQAAQEGIGYELDLRGNPSTFRDSLTRWYHTTGKVVKDTTGQVLRLTGTLADITERKQAEEQLKDYAVLLEFQKNEAEKANAELEEANALLENLAITDGLTGLHNHRAFQERLTEEVSRTVRYNTPLSLVLLDVDKFKSYNDTHGHPAGDAVLKAVASVLQSCARDTDMVARYGGEEFVFILTQTDLGGATTFAERLRAAVEGHPWPIQAITASFGVASLNPADESGGELVIRADAALYRSKKEGRNRVTCDGVDAPLAEIQEGQIIALG